ncbi:hypothetical protein F7731_05030 [Cytobacillus depressus]|uniref:Lipoprotein n=1 Tax=Cytobacillus depressus TaxID=1602942 RepID=A0A6L3VDN1_9BACI|nr:DUF6612 family protein [Cytobacillus depressus]KAB2339009.1 hypothetical protein F7731_05030 [Cytobacillus depressus]
MSILKKTLSILAGFLLIFMLAACNQTATPVNKEGTNKTEPEVTEKPSELTLEEVLEKSTEASNGLKSFSVKMDVEQDMSSDQEELNMNTQSIIEMDVVTDPMAFYQKMTMSLADTGENFQTESYFSEDGMFFYEPSGQQWMKFPQEMTDAFLQMAGQQSNPGDELKKLQKFVEDFTFEQDAKNYILKLKASGDKFNDFIKETAAEALPPEMAMEGLMDDMKINAVEYEFLIDKESFYPVALDVLMEMEMTIEDQTIVMKQKMNGQYSKLNEIEAITVPQEVIDSAVEMEF